MDPTKNPEGLAESGLIPGGQQTFTPTETPPTTEQ